MTTLLQRQTLLLLLAALASLPMLAGCGGVGKNEMLQRAKLRAAMNRVQANVEEEEEPHPPETSNLEQASAGAAPTRVVSPASLQPTVDDSPRMASVTSSSSEPEEPKQSTDPSAPPPIAAITPAQRTLQAAPKLEQIAAAMLAYAKIEGKFPPRGLNKLSWRVYLLPQLGHEQLFNQFRLNEAWDSPHNLALVENMPEVYRMPGRGGTKTNFFAASGPATLFSHPARSKPLRALGENAADTLMLIEANEEAAAPWTEPADYVRDRKNPVAGLGGLNGGDALVAWANGEVTRLSVTAPQDKLLLAFRLLEDDDVKGLDLGSVSRAVEAPTTAMATTSVGVPTAGPGGAAPSDATTTAARSRAQVSQLAAQYLAAAKASYAAGNRIDGWKWLSGAIVAGLPASQWSDDFHWTPGLRRPTLGLHIGVVALTDLRENEGSRRRGNETTLDDLREHLLLATAPLGEPMVALLEDHARSLLPALLAPDAPDPRRRLPPPQTLSYLPTSTSLGETRRAAQEAGCDVLAVLSVDHSDSRRTRSVEVVLYDLRRSRSQALLDMRKVTVGIGQRVLDQQTAKKLQAAKWRLKDYLEDALTPGDWPVKLTQSIAERRLKALGATSATQPLPILIEMRYYRNLGLADDVQLLGGVNTLIGAKRGAQLLLGSDLKKRRVLRHWLPSDDSDTVMQLAERNRRRADDDD